MTHFLENIIVKTNRLLKLWNRIFKTHNFNMILVVCFIYTVNNYK